MTPSRLPLRFLPLCLAAFSLSPAANAQSFSSPPPEIVSAWKANAENFVVAFQHDGSFYVVDGEVANPGLERGTFEWDKATGAFTANVLVDTDGDAGFSHPGAAATLSITGNTLSYSEMGGGTYTLTRVVNTASEIVGSWYVPGVRVSLTFLEDGTYYLAQEENDAPFGYDGIEFGTYTWNSSKKGLTANPLRDTNGDIGLSDLPPGFTATITGNTMVLSNGSEVFTLQRVVTNLSPLHLPDFYVARGTSYLQTSNATPTLRPYDVVGGSYPYQAGAFVGAVVGATNPTMKIGSGTPIAISSNDPGEYDFEAGFVTPAELNSFLPNSSAVQFKSGAAFANLTTAASGTFPSIPKLLAADGGMWSGNTYQFGDNEVLRWTLPAGFDVTKYVTIVDVADPDTGAEIATVELQGNITNYDLAGKLDPDNDYKVELQFIRIDSSTTAGTGVFAGKQGHAFSTSNNLFMVHSTGTEAPFISEQPVSQTGTTGSPLLLSVGINQGAFPTATFQWFRNNVKIEGQTGNSLYIPNYSTAANAGSYVVKVTNAQDTVTSNPAILGNPTVEFVVVGKSVEYAQTGPSTVVIDPRPVGPLYGGPFGFNANVHGSTTATPTVTPPAGTPNSPGDPFYNSLFYSAEDSQWRYGPNANDWGGLSQSAIDNRFPNGTYTFLVNGVSIPLTLTGNAYPNTPQITLSGGSWVNGKYAMDSANPLTLTTNVFAGYGSNVDGRISLAVNDSELEYLRSNSPANNFATRSVPGNTLPTNEVTYVEADFSAIVNKSTALADSVAAAFYGRITRMEVHILPKIIAQTASQVLASGTSLNLHVEASGSPATASGQLDYQWMKNGLNIPGLTTSSFGIPTFSADDSGTYTCTVSNDVGSATSPPIYLEFADAFQSYVATFGLNSVTTGAPDADYDNDGIPNLLEYLLGGNPTLSSSGLVPTITKSPGANNVVFTYKRKVSATGVTQVIEHATTLSPPWTPAVNGQNGVTIVTALVPSDATTEQVTVTIPSSSSSRFVRLRASR